MTSCAPATPRTAAPTGSSSPTGAAPPTSSAATGSGGWRAHSTGGWVGQEPVRRLRAELGRLDLAVIDLLSARR